MQPWSSFQYENAWVNLSGVVTVFGECTTLTRHKHTLLETNLKMTTNLILWLLNWSTPMSFFFVCWINNVIWKNICTDCLANLQKYSQQIFPIFERKPMNEHVIDVHMCSTTANWSLSIVWKYGRKYLWNNWIWIFHVSKTMKAFEMNSANWIFDKLNSLKRRRKTVIRF